MPEPKYVMPPARVGFAVWYPDKTNFLASPIPCIVTVASDRSVSLTVWAEDNKGGLPKDGVRHISDPEVDKMAGYTAGVWDYAPDTKELFAFKARLGGLETGVAALIEAFGGMPASAG